MIQAERIEAQGLIPSLTITENGRLAVHLYAKKSKVYDMKLVIGKKSSPSGQWGMDIQGAGPVSIQGLVVDATALGFKIKGPLLQLDKPLPAVVLYDVYLKVEQMNTDRVSMPQVNLQTKQDVILSSDNPVIDMSRLPKANGLEALTDTVNDLLARFSGSGSTEDSPGTGSENPSNQPLHQPPTQPPLPEDDPQPPTKKPPVRKPDPDPPLEPPNDLTKPPILPPNNGGDVVDKGKSVVKKVIVKLKNGLDHVLTVLRFVQEARKYDHTEITIQKGDKKADAKNLLEVLGMMLTRGTEIILTAEGKEAKQAVETLADLISGRE
ncbi:HPr family phosphocarrier protein [Polycladomyces sp. WAk]|uniref:Phosphocarrier protein HPr n=1 Tax=Polycladomyces zharkentensis TaxID=2807616 RepID=A0ABS2WMU8_9BACL|nr:HPr family phosphocarrier protein [Polycladomyces sp. WAk]